MHYIIFSRALLINRILKPHTIITDTVTELTCSILFFLCELTDRRRLQKRSKESAERTFQRSRLDKWNTCINGIHQSQSEIRLKLHVMLNLFYILHQRIIMVRANVASDKLFYYAIGYFK